MPGAPGGWRAARLPLLDSGWFRHHAGMVPTRAAPPITFADFERVDIRVGRILRADDFAQARTPAYKLAIDFGPEIGTLTSSAQLTVHYRREELVGRLVVAVINFPPRQIGPVRSDVLTLGVPDENGAVVLLAPDKDVPVGGRMF
jgi:tRNA-binding protein